MNRFLLIVVILKLSSLILEAQDYEYENFDCYYSGPYLRVLTRSPWASRRTIISGDIKINLQSNLTEGQLEHLFQNITAIQGSIVVEGTNLKQLNFLKNVVEIDTYHSSYAVEIIDNPLLTYVNFDKFNSSDGIMRIQRNPQLDVSSLCSRLDEVFDKNWVVTGNKVDCGGFYLDFPLTFTSIFNVPPNLTVIQGDVILQNTGIPQERLAVFSSKKKIAGCSTVGMTNLETLSFFENLEEIKCLDRNNPAIKIYSNNYLNYLGLSKLTKISSTRAIICQRNRILEITHDEVNVLMSTGLRTAGLNGMFSSENLPWDVCVFNSLTDDLITIPLNCTSLIGILHYEHRSFLPSEMVILSRIRHIYGSIKLVNVDITDLSMFSELERVISLNDSVPAIQLDSMSALKSITMPKLKLVYAPHPVRFAIDNCPNLNLTLPDCAKLHNVTQNVYMDELTCDQFTFSSAMKSN